MPKRNAHGSGTIRQRKDGTWEARYTVGRDPGTGKQVQKSIYGKTQSEVLVKLQAVQHDINTGTYTDPTKMTVGQWLDEWLEDYPGDVKERTLNEYKGVVAHRIKPGIGNVKLADLNTQSIQRFYNTCLRGTKDKKAISAKTTRNLHGVLHKALEQAVDLGYIRINPATKCKLPRVEKPEIKPLDDSHISAFLQAISGNRFELVFTVDLFTGMRQGEILGLSWKSVDLKDGTITINQQLQLIKGQYKIVPTKNDRIRKITPAPYIMQLLRQRKARQAADQLRAGTAWDNPWKLVFTDELGKHYARQTVYGNFKRIVRKIGIDESRFHDLRHSYAVASLQSGDDIKTLQENLGHHAAGFTLDIYGHVSEKMKQESSQRMERYIKSVTTENKA
ncbi:site-specific integrase [Ruminococcaceae bacterium OttesenSCG-928-L11]|nr:site-specific integrase [Ruminococcaceae bacterium OttesenSCG-928-L11]